MGRHLAEAGLLNGSASRRGGPLSTQEFTLTDADGDVQLFTTETFGRVTRELPQLLANARNISQVEMRGKTHVLAASFAVNCPNQKSGE
jgi:hypothetical protein